MTSISLNPTTHVLAITGSNNNDLVQVCYGVKQGSDATGNPVQVSDPSTVNVSILTDYGYQVTGSFATASVSSIAFQGQQGNDYFSNSTNIAASVASWTGGTVNTSFMPGSPNDPSAASSANLGVFTVGSTGQVGVDYLYDGAGYRGQVAIYSLAGMDQYTPGTAAYNQEAARRALSNSTLGHVVISVRNETAKYEGNMPWEGDFWAGHGAYQGVKSFAMTAGDTFSVMLVPNGLVSDVYSNPSAGGSLQPLYSVPGANPYVPTSQMLGQLGDLDGHGSLFAFEDQRLDGSSDRDYNDVVFQVTGARATSTPVSDVLNASRNMYATDVGKALLSYAKAQEMTDQAAVSGTFSSGTFTVGSTGQVGVNFVYDGGGYHGEMALFSLQGMAGLVPGSTDFIREAARRALSNSILGHVVISDNTEGAEFSGNVGYESNFNDGTYLGVKTFTMTTGDTFGVMLVPNGTVWQVYNNPAAAGALRPLFSMAAANPASAFGSNQLAQLDTAGALFGWEDMRLDGSSDRDYNDMIYRLSGAVGTAPALSSVVNAAKNWTATAVGQQVLATSV